MVHTGGKKPPKDGGSGLTEPIQETPKEPKKEKEEKETK